MSDDSRTPELDGAALRAHLGPPWRQLDLVEQTGSTNADLLARAGSGADIDGVVLIAEAQTAGRGRNGRRWSTPPGSHIALSVGVGVGDVPADAWGWLPLLTGVAVVDAVTSLTATPVGLKWPNDVLADGGKLAGILAEVAAPRQAIVIGVGLNVAGRPDDAAISLADLRASTLDRNALIPRIMRELGARIVQWRASGGHDAQLMTDYRARSVTVGSRVRATLPGDHEIVGIAQSVDTAGRLRIDTGTGVETVSAGDITHLRPLNP